MECDCCGKDARYVVSMEITILDYEGPRDRKKIVWVTLCEACEGASRNFWANDRVQKRRVARALVQPARSVVLRARKALSEGRAEDASFLLSKIALGGR